MRAGIALGSNLGDRAANIRKACNEVEHLGEPGASLAGPVIETEPVDCPLGAPPFLNTVIEIECSLPPVELLEKLRQIERRLGREVASVRNAPRPIDLDLLYAGDAEISTHLLTLPHARMTQRRFVLQPLAAIRPHLVLPGQQKSVAELLAALEDKAAAA